MTLTDKRKCFYHKIKTNQVQHSLDRETAKSSALSSEELDNYIYLTGKDLGYKPGVAEQATFHYCPLGKGLVQNDKKQGLLKRLENIDDKKEKQSKLIENKGSKQKTLVVKSIIDVFNDDLFQRAKNNLCKLSNQENDIKRLSLKIDKYLEIDFTDY